MALVVLVVLLFGLIGFNYYSDYQVKKMGEQFNKGFNEAINQMSIVILSEVQTEGYVNINYGNKTITLIPYLGEQNE